MLLSTTLIQRLEYSGMKFNGTMPDTDELIAEALKHGHHSLLTITQCRDGGWLAVLGGSEGEGDTYAEALARLILNSKDGIISRGSARVRLKSLQHGKK